METQVKLPKTTISTLGIVMMLLFSLVSFNFVNAQQGRTIKGVITNSDGPLESASIILKGTKTGTATDAKGEFTFPQPLKTGDVLLVTYLGFEPQEVVIKDSTDFVKLQLTEDLVEFIGALNSDTPYKSKRSND
ncbi:MAG: carboxypeptidase-like regulatory domain-containing protein [Gelidibacter sp.]